MPVPEPLHHRSVRVGARNFDIAYDDTYGSGLGETFEPELSALLTAAVVPGAVAFDVGANLGLTALLMSQSASVVHAFEAVPSTHELLSRNVGAEPNIVAHPYGLGDRPGTATITRDVNNRSGAFLGATTLPEGHASELAQISTLDAAASLLGPDERLGLIKIDVEGFELQVLRGGRALLAAQRPAVLLEMNHWCLNAFQRTSIPDFLDELTATFPCLYALDDRTGQVADLHDPGAAFGVMHEHIVRFRFMTVLGCYDRDQAVPVLQAAEARAAALDDPPPLPAPAKTGRLRRRLLGQP